MTVSQAAQHFRVDQATIRRWLAAGCPCLRKGRKGPGGGAVLDLDAVKQWRGMAEASEPDPVLTLERIASALQQALIEDKAHIRAGVSREDAAAVLLVVFDRCCQEFKYQYRFDALPEPIRALTREL